MTEQELQALAGKVQERRSEERTLEVKAAHSGCPQKLYGTLSAFSNQDEGGILLFGLDESSDFAAVGVYNAQDLQKRVTEQCKQMTPALRPLFTVARYQEKTIVSAEIPALDLSERPCFYSGVGRLKGSYVRVGEADEPMSEYEIYSYEAYRKKYQDDIRTVPQAAMETIQGKALKDYVAKASRDNPNLARLKPEEKHELLSLTRGGLPTLTCTLLFSLYPQAFFPQYTIQATVVPGDTMGEVDVDGARFTDNRRIEGTLPEMLERALDFCQKNMGLRTVVDPGTGERKDRPDYPLIALREAILNALIHRDYSLHTQGIPIGMTFYRDRWELRSPGGLYGRLTIDEIGKVQPDTRNPILARAMETLSFVENRYSGIPTIRRELREASLREPVFRSVRGEFQVVFFKTLAVPDTGTSSDSGQITEGRATDLAAFCSTPRSREEIAERLGLKSWHYVKKFYLDPLLASGVLKMTIPEKPKSRNQRYHSRSSR